MPLILAKTASQWRCANSAGLNEVFLPWIGSKTSICDGVGTGPKWRGWPLNPSAIFVRPLLKHGGHFYLFHVPLVERSALKLLEQIIKDADEAYWQQSFLPKRDRYLESTSLELLRNLLPGCRSFQGLYYDCVDDGLQKRAEVDGLLIFDDTLLICRSQGIEVHGRGAIKRLKSDVEAIVDNQAHRVLDLARSAPIAPQQPTQNCCDALQATLGQGVMLKLVFSACV